MNAVVQPPPTRRLARQLPRRPSPLACPEPPRPSGRRVQATAAWRLVRALRARYPGRLHVVEAGDWTEGLHVLVLCDARRPAGADHSPLAMLNVGGSLHVVARADGRPLRADVAVDFRAVPWGRLCQGGGGEQGRAERGHVRDLTVRAIAAVLGL